MPESVTAEADRIVSGERQDNYGHPFDAFTKLSKLVEGIVGVEVTPEQTCMIMLALKMSRELNKPFRDNRVDMAGYAKVLDMIVVERERRAGEERCECGVYLHACAGHKDGLPGHARVS